MKNRMSRFFERTEIEVECPYCHEARVTIPYGSEPALCPVCDASFKAEKCPEGNQRCRGHIECEPSAELLKTVNELQAEHRARQRAQKEFPHEWLPCWQESCRGGVEVVRKGKALIAVGPCDECSGTGKIPRP